MLTALLVVLAVLTGVVAGLAWRIARELSAVVSHLSAIELAVAAHMPKVSDEVTSAPDRSPAAVSETPAASVESAAPAAVRRGRRRRGTVVLPNGQRRVDYIRDRYYRDGMSRATIRAEINALWAGAGVERRNRRRWCTRRRRRRRIPVRPAACRRPDCRGVPASGRARQGGVLRPIAGERKEHGALVRILDGVIVQNRSLEAVFWQRGD